jgi:peptide/nickel transport system substrate-binding protein
MATKNILLGCLLLILLSSLSLSGCGKAETPVATEGASTGQPATGAPASEPPVANPGEKAVTITFTNGDPESLNPLYAYSWTAECLFDLTLLPLWNIDDGGNYVMELAEELPTQENGGVSADGLTITIKIRPEAVWSDGVPVTAGDAIFTYDMIMEKANTTYSRFPWGTYVESLRAEDDHTLVIKLAAPYADWSIRLFSGISRVIPKHILQPVFEAQGTLDDADWNRLPVVSNGPFKVIEFEPGSHLALAANERYWRGRPKLDKIFMRLTEDRAVQLSALASGESDIGTYIIGSEVPDLDATHKVQIMISNNGYQVLVFENIDPKTAHPAMTDVNVRRAIITAIDREQINKSLYHSLYNIPATYWSGSEYDNPGLKPYPFDPAAASKLLDEAGWVDINGDGVREKGGRDLALRYAYINGEPTTDAMVVSIQKMLADVGIKIDIIPYTSDVLWAAYKDKGPLALGKFDLSHWSDGMWYYPSPDTRYFLCSERASADNPAGYNWFGICLPVLDDLFARQAVELDHNKRVEILHQIGKIMYDQVLIIPLHSDPDMWAVNNRLANVRFSGVDPLMFAYEWDIK